MKTFLPKWLDVSRLSSSNLGLNVQSGHSEDLVFGSKVRGLVEKVTIHGCEVSNHWDRCNRTTLEMGLVVWIIGACPSLRGFRLFGVALQAGLTTSN